MCYVIETSKTKANVEYHSRDTVSVCYTSSHITVSINNLGKNAGTLFLIFDELEDFLKEAV